MVKSLISFLILLVGLVGCTTVPVNMNLSQQNHGLDLNTDKEKYPFEVAILLPDSFSEYSLKSTLNNANITWDFKYDLGNDFAKTLPDFLEKRFKTIKVINTLDTSDKFDFVFIPDISKSKITIGINTTLTQEPVYALEINLGVVFNKNGKEYSSTSFKQAIEEVTEIACWTCWGKDILNQNKIEEQYKHALSNVYAKLDTYLIETIK